MASNNHIPDMMAANYWPHITYAGQLRQNQGDYAGTPANNMIPLQPNPVDVKASAGMGSSTPSVLRRHSVATATATSAPTMDSTTGTVGAGGERSGRPHQEEDEPDGLCAAPAPPSQKPIRRRMRMITSCLECRRRKLKCEKKSPCHNCKRFQRECVYLGPNLDEASQQRLTEIKEKVGSLERQLERDVAKGATSRRSGSPNRHGDGDQSRQQRFVADDVEDELGEERDLQITPMVALDLTYDDYSDGNGTDDLIDLGVRVGKMRITERIGGLNRPRISEEVNLSLLLGMPVLIPLTLDRSRQGLATPPTVSSMLPITGLRRTNCKMRSSFRIFSGLERHTSLLQAASSLDKRASRLLSSACCRHPTLATS
jgi:hypothetical protein